MTEKITNGKLYREVGELTQSIRSLRDEIQRNREESNVRDDEIKTLIQDIQKIPCHWIEEHHEYHRGNEEHWGLQTYMKHHLKATVITFIIVGLLLASAFGVTLTAAIEWITKVNRAIH